MKVGSDTWFPAANLEFPPISCYLQTVFFNLSDSGDKESFARQTSGNQHVDLIQTHIEVLLI